MSAEAAAVAEPEVVPVEEAAKPKDDKRPKKQPRYHVILWNDDDHSFGYVIKMLKELFAHPEEKGFLLATEVHEMGKAVVLTTTLEHAELKRDQIKAYGEKAEFADSKGSMSASIEAAPE